MTGEVDSRLLNSVERGIDSLDVPDKYKKSSLDNIRKWLTEKEFEEYRDQIKYLIKNKSFSRDSSSPPTNQDLSITKMYILSS